MCEISSVLHLEGLVRSRRYVRKVPVWQSLRPELGIRHLQGALDCGHWAPLMSPTPNPVLPAGQRCRGLPSYHHLKDSSVSRVRVSPWVNSFLMPVGLILLGKRTPPHLQKNNFKIRLKEQSMVRWKVVVEQAGAWVLASSQWPWATQLL